MTHVWRQLTYPGGLGIPGRFVKEALGSVRSFVKGDAPLFMLSLQKKVLDPF